ncbi:MAG TPA: GDP-mannose 4,6-dehydratase [Thermoguttaceae bacterium]|nr:GDP-mannose 4,6-dehydratase [Thermoguttaceae bacterium]
MRYLVTGCAGFIGWKTTELLLRSGAEVVGLDDLNDAYDVRLKQWRLELLKAFEKFQFFQADITHTESVEKVFARPAGKRSAGSQEVLSAGEGRRRPILNGAAQGGGGAGSPGPFDAVIHLAARAGVRASVQQPEVYFRTNGLGTLVLLEACRRHGVRKFLLASTSALYGAHNPTPYQEDADTSRPLSPYAASKKAAECLAYTYHYLHGLDVTVLRYFTVYGPAGRPDMSVFRFVRQIAEGEPVWIYGDGSQRRDFTYVEDIARGTLAALDLQGFDVINLGGDRPVSVRELLERIGQLVGKPVRAEHRPSHPADVPATWADIRRAAEKLAWRPQTSLEEGLAQTVAWYQQHRSWAAQVDLGQ